MAGDGSRCEMCEPGTGDYDQPYLIIEDKLKVTEKT